MQRTFHATVKPFIGGLNTELSQAEETPQYTADELNCRILSDGSRSRRYGMGLEADGDFLYTDENEIYSSYLWVNVANNALDVLVSQVGTRLVFRKAIKPFSDQPIFFTLDLTDYIIDSIMFKSSQMAYITGAGYLFVVNKYMDSILLKYDEDTDTIEVSKPSFKVRDFEGLDDGLDVEEMPADLTGEHQYNLENQGWSLENINTFYSQKNKYPSNNLVWYLGKDNTGSFDVTTLTNVYFGNTPAPKGHYILDALTKDRTNASGIIASGKTQPFSQQVWWNVRKNKYWGYLNDNGIGSVAQYECANNPGKLQQVAMEIQLSQSKKNAPRTWNFKEPIKVWVDIFSNNTWTRIDEQIVSPTYDGVTNEWTYEYTMNTPADYRDVESSKFRYGFDIQVWWTVYAIKINGRSIVGEYKTFSTTALPYRVCDVDFTAGHFFYLLNNRLLFSQTVTENIKNFDKCYQDADPTSERISDIIDTDGGEIMFTDLGAGVGLAKCSLGLLVFGDRSVYGVVSGVAGNFVATSYTTQFVNAAGCVSNGSIVETEEGVFYWSPQGIFQISENTVTGISLNSANISVGTIQTFYQSIPIECKKYCRSVYDFNNRVIYWYYPSDDEHPLQLDCCLVFDLKHASFHPYKLAEGGYVVAPFLMSRPEEIIPEVLLYAGEDIVASEDNDVIATEYSSDYNEYSALCHLSKIGNQLAYTQYNSRDFVDWRDYDFDAYMVSYPLIVTDMISYKQTPIVQTTFIRTEEAKLADGNYIAPTGCKYRTRWSWSVGDESNRWDMMQNCYHCPSNFDSFKYITSKIVVRGRGKAFQIELRNDQNKDMRIAGITTIIRGE